MTKVYILLYSVLTPEYNRRCNYMNQTSFIPSLLLAGGADKAAGVVSLSQGGHHLPLDEVLATEAASPVHPLVVQSADVFTLPHEEASLGQFTSTH